MTFPIKLFILIVSLIILAPSVFPALAQIQPITGQQGQLGFPDAPALTGDERVGDIINFLELFILMAAYLIGTIAVIFLIYAGFKYISSRGDEEEAKRAKAQIAYAVIGIIVALGAPLIKDAIIRTGGEGPAAGAGIITDLLLPFIVLTLLLVGITAVIFLIYAGVKYITSQGDEEQANQAKRQITYAVIGLILVLLAFSIVSYLGAPLPADVTPTPPLIGSIYLFVNLLLPLVSIAAVIFIIYAGVKYISSQGDEEQANQAKRQITYAVIGLVVVFLSAAIVRLIIPVGSFLDTYEGNVGEGIYPVVNNLLALAGIAAVIYIIYAGVKYITSQGDEEQTNQAKRQIAYAFIGLLVIFISAAIVNLIFYID